MSVKICKTERAKHATLMRLNKKTSKKIRIQKALQTRHNNHDNSLAKARLAKKIKQNSIQSNKNVRQTAREHHTSNAQRRQSYQTNCVIDLQNDLKYLLSKVESTLTEYSQLEDIEQSTMYVTTIIYT